MCPPLRASSHPISFQNITTSTSLLCLPQKYTKHYKYNHTVHTPKKHSLHGQRETHKMTTESACSHKVSFSYIIHFFVKLRNCFISNMRVVWGIEIYTNNERLL